MIIVCSRWPTEEVNSQVKSILNILIINQYCLIFQSGATQQATMITLSYDRLQLISSPNLDLIRYHRAAWPKSSFRSPSSTSIIMIISIVLPSNNLVHYSQSRDVQVIRAFATGLATIGSITRWGLKAEEPKENLSKPIIDEISVLVRFLRSQAPSMPVVIENQREFDCDLPD